MSFRGPSILKLNGGLGQKAPSDRNVAGLIIANGYEVSTTFTFGNAYKLSSLDDAEALGLSASTDANALTDSTALIWYHISEYFRLNPDGTLYVYNGDAIAVSDLFSAPTLALMALSANGIRHLGVVFGVDPGATVTITNNFPSWMPQAIALAQQWVDDMYDAFVFIDNVTLEGYRLGPSAPTDLKTKNAPQVSVVVANDHGYLADLITAEPKVAYTAAVGTVLGSIGVRMLSESIGSMVLEKLPDDARGRADYSLVDTRKNRWLDIYYSNGVAFNDSPQGDRDALTAAAHIYVGRFEGYPGVTFNADPTCTTSVDDFNTIHINRVWNEVARSVRRALIPRMNSRVQIDPDSGRIKASTIADWDAAAKRAVNDLQVEDEISDFRFSLDPNQDVIANGKVTVKVSIVPQGIAKAIEALIGFTNPAQ